MFDRVLNPLLQYVRTPAARTADEFGDAIEEEIAFHLAERVNEYQSHGMTADDAHRAALARFGDPSRIAAECHASAIGGLALLHRVHLVMTLALAVAVAILWFAASKPTDVAASTALELPPSIQSMLDNDWTGDIVGRVLDDHAQPIERATVLVVVKTWPDGSYFQRSYSVVTDNRGQFHVENVYPVNEEYEVQLVAVVEERALQSSYLTRDGGQLEPITFALEPSAGLTLEIETEPGATSARIEVLPQARRESSGDHHPLYFDSVQPLLRRTDRLGRVRLSYFQSGDTADVLVRTPGGKWISHQVVVPAAGETAKIRATDVQSHKES